MTETMRALAMTTRGNLDDLRVMDVPIPMPGPGEVRVKIVAAAVNPADHKVASGQFAGNFLHAKVSPHIPGFDLSGMVDALGEGVEDLAVGDAVFGHLPYAGSTRGGTFCEYATIAADAIAKKPDAIGHDTAAALATAGLTSLQDLRDHAGLRDGGHALVIGASGGVGSLAVGIAKRLGATVTGVCSTSAIDFVRSLGADTVLDRKKDDPFAGEPRFDVVFDTPSAYGFLRAAPVLRPGGTYVATLPSPRFVVGKLASLFSSKRVRLGVVQSKRKDLETLAAWAADGLPVPIDERFAVTDGAQAITTIAKGGRHGRVVIDVSF